MTSRDTSGEKQQISFNLSVRNLAGLRKKAEEGEVSLNEAMRSILNDYFGWYQLPETVIEVLRADAKKRAKDEPRSYVIELMMKRYTELMFEQQHSDKRK